MPTVARLNHLFPRPLLMIAGAVLLFNLFAATLSAPARAADVTVYKSPSYGCCSEWAKHMQANGHRIKTVQMENLEMVKKMLGVPDEMQSCHTAVVDGYVIEGHVPATDVARLLAEQPKARGLAVPGMPMGSPGMEGPRKDRYSVILFGNDGSGRIYSKH